jgi:hypothetical protein
MQAVSGRFQKSERTPTKQITVAGSPYLGGAVPVGSGYITIVTGGPYPNLLGFIAMVLATKITPTAPQLQYILDVLPSTNSTRNK